MRSRKKKKYNSCATTQKNAVSVLPSIGLFLFHTWNVREQGAVRSEWERWHAALNFSKHCRTLYRWPSSFPIRHSWHRLPEQRGHVFAQTANVHRVVSVAAGCQHRAVLPPSNTLPGQVLRRTAQRAPRAAKADAHGVAVEYFTQICTTEQ